MPFGFSGKFTFTSETVLIGNSNLNTLTTYGSSVAKSGSRLSLTFVLNAIPRDQSNAPCLAAASVRQCQHELPKFKPRLIPERTTSTWPQQCMPCATQSAG